MYKAMPPMSLLGLLISLMGCSPLLDLGEVTPVDGGTDVKAADRNYQCGYAMPGFDCNNGRSHALVVAPDMTSGIAMCHTVQPMPTLDFCYAIDSDGAASTDASQCAAAAGSWRPGNSCCNFKGTLSCP